jgi:hypothetical protein
LCVFLVNMGPLRAPFAPLGDTPVISPQHLAPLVLLESTVLQDHSPAAIAQLGTMQARLAPLRVAFVQQDDTGWQATN